MYNPKTELRCPSEGRKENGDCVIVESEDDRHVKM